MNRGRVVVLSILSVILVLGCSLPGGAPVPVKAPAAVAGGGFSLSTDVGRNVGVLTTPSGAQVDIQAVEADGSLVSCVLPASVTPLSDGTSADGTSAKGLGRAPWTVLVTGTRTDGRPGAWTVSSNHTVQPLLDANSGQMSSCLPDSDDEDGTFHGGFGWAYHVAGTSENGLLIAGYAQATRDITRHGVTIEKGTTIGVYWRVWKHSWRSMFVMSHARVIGILDPSKIPAPSDRGRYWRNWLSRHLLHAGLRFFLLDYLSSYLTMVDANGVHFDSSKNLYTVSGTDQEVLPAVATINDTGVVSIVETAPPPPPVTVIDLAPGQLTTTAAAVADGGTLGVTFTLNNLQPGSVTTAFTVDFHLALGSTFSPSTDPTVGSAPVAAGSGPAGNSSIPLSATLSIPAGTLNQDVYLYAVVDPTGQLTETGTANNTSTPDMAAVVLVWNSANPARTYGVRLDTYAPSGSGVVNTVMGLYDSTGAYLQSVNDTVMNGYAVIDRTSSPLAPGTYYVLVTSWADGPYAMAVRTPGIDLRRNFPLLTSKAADPYGVNNNPNIFPLNQSLPFLPSPVVIMAVGSTVNRYTVNNTDDWFTFTLP